MKKIFLKIGLATLTTFSLLITSCSSEGVEITEEVSINELPNDVLTKIHDLKLNPKNFTVKDMGNLDGTTTQLVVISGDMAMKKSRFLKIGTDKGGISKQYQTEFLIDTDIHEEVNLIAYTGETIFTDGVPTAIGLSEIAQRELINAVNTWNSVHSKLKLKVDFTSEASFDLDFFETAILVSPTLDGLSGMAGFPDENGNPGDFLIISPDANQVSEEFSLIVRHLFTHELGHAIGFRHTDWNSRQSCVDSGSELETTVEDPAPEIIFGTLPSIPGVITQESVMNACHTIEQATGILNSFDEIALKNLYPIIY